MLFADAAVIAIDVVAAGTLGTTLAAGIVGAARLFVNFLDRHDERVTKEITASRSTNEKLTSTLIAVQRQTSNTTADLTGVIDKLSDRMDRWEKQSGTDHHEPLPDHTR